jgi:photosystem II stability/assembly factor-like uncharacterized protein
MFDRWHGFSVGFSFSDPRAHLDVIVTGDSGRTWETVEPTGVDEFVFSDGGNCATATGRKGFFGTISLEDGNARVYRTDDFGLTWESTRTPTYPEALDFRTNRLGLALNEYEYSPARTTDGGVTWEPIDKSVAPDSPGVDVAWWSDDRGDERASVPAAKRTVIIVGDGSYVSVDRGKSWHRFDNRTFYSVECAEGSPACWAAGPDGHIAKLVVD